jgi:adenylate cyclase
MRVSRTFGFVDVSGFTALTKREGDEAAVRVLIDFRSMLRETCSRRGVRIAKWLGDGAMLVCVDTAPLLATVLEIEHGAGRSLIAERNISVRSGVTTGAVILLEGDDYVGHSVNIAARLCDQAPDGVVLALPSVVDDLPRWATVESRQQLELRGIDEPLGVVRLGVAPPPRGATTDPVCGLPIWSDAAEATAVDGLGRAVLFCADSCRDTWLARPGPAADELGSVRIPLIGS